MIIFSSKWNFREAKQLNEQSRKYWGSDFPSFCRALNKSLGWLFKGKSSKVGCKMLAVPLLLLALNTHSSSPSCFCSLGYDLVVKVRPAPVPTSGGTGSSHKLWIYSVKCRVPSQEFLGLWILVTKCGSLRLLEAIVYGKVDIHFCVCRLKIGGGGGWETRYIKTTAILKYYDYRGVSFKFNNFLYFYNQHALILNKYRGPERKYRGKVHPNPNPKPTKPKPPCLLITWDHWT